MQNVFQKGYINIWRVKNPVIERVELSEGIVFGVAFRGLMLEFQYWIPTGVGQMFHHYRNINELSGCLHDERILVLRRWPVSWDGCGSGMDRFETAEFGL